ncbi:MAG TPA: cytochrome c [Burkholderiales bacterium]|nr:cytochrome c [Burkholderiales bacterium]
MKFPRLLPALLLLLPALGLAEQKVADEKGPDGKPLYTVVDGYKVDAQTLKGFKAWRAAACDRCHGANQQGLVGPSLIDSLKRLSKEDFVKTITEGRLEKGMPSWKNSKMVMGNIDQLYAYLKGRSDGAITKAHVQPIE